MLAYSEKPKRPKPGRRATSPIIPVIGHFDLEQLWPRDTRPHRSLSHRPTDSCQDVASGLTDQHRRRIEEALYGSVSANTRRSYASAWRCFEEWTQARDVPALPAPAEFSGLDSTPKLFLLTG